MQNYIKGFFSGVGSLLTGMKVTGREFITPKVTEQYPENRATLKMYDRFRGTLAMRRDEKGNLLCIGCGLCQMACPNDTIRISTEMIDEPGTDKKRRIITGYSYDLGSCMFCQLCVNACPHDAIEFTTDFEHAVFTREKLVKELTLKKQ